MITSKVEAPAPLKHAGGETSIFWWLNSENVIPQRSFFICGFKPHEHAMLRLKARLNMTRYGNFCRGKRSTMIAMFMQFKDSGNQRWGPPPRPTCHVCFEDILIPVAPYEEVSPAITGLDFPGHFSGTKFPHNAQQFKSSSWAKLVHGCAPQVWYLGRVSGVLSNLVGATAQI